MKKVIFAAIVVSLTGCSVAYPIPHHGYVNPEPIIVSQHQRDVVYVWDPIRFLYYFVDHRQHKHYMPRDWRHRHHGHHGDPRYEYERHQHRHHHHDRHGHDKHNHNKHNHGHDRR